MKAHRSIETRRSNVHWAVRMGIIDPLEGCKLYLQMDEKDSTTDKEEPLEEGRQAKKKEESPRKGQDH